MDTSSVAVPSQRDLPDPYPHAVRLSEALLVGKGFFRLVFEHPQFPGALIKVFRPERISAEGDLICRRRRLLQFKLRRRLGAHALTLRELTEHLAFQARHARSWRERPFAAVLGVVDTDLGLGLVVERIAGPSGGLAPTLDSLLKSGLFSDAHRGPLERFFRSLEEHHVCIGDLRPKNVVLTGAPGQEPRFVAIDGTGLHSAIPIQDWFKPINTHQVRKRARRIWALVDRHLQAQPPFPPQALASAA